MKRISIVLGAVTVLLAALSAYLYDGRRRAESEISALRSNNSVLEARAEEVEAEISRLQSARDDLVSAMRSEIDQGQITITQLSDRLSVSIVDRVLFPSGRADISPAGMEILTRVGTILNQTPDRIIHVEGHTDNVPISPRIQREYATNWELSTARATNVVRLLQESVGIGGSRLRAVGMSEYHPVASNDTPAGRAQNRRIEIVLLSN